MNLSPLPIQKFFDNNGKPLDGGQLFTYVSGTSTKLATYKDQAGTLNSNPIVLDFRGEANVWLDQTLTYKFVLAPVGDTDPPTKPIWTVDNISAAVTYASLTQQILGQIIYPRTPAEIAAAVTPVNYIYPPGYVLRYGTNTAPGTTDMAAAINSANASWNGTGGKVTFPAGTLAYASQILVTARGIQWIGEGASELNGTGSANRGATCLLRTFAGTAASGIIFNADDCGIDQIDIDGNLQGSKCHNLEVWGGRFYYGRVSSRNATGRGQRFGRDDSPTGGNNASRSNVNFLKIVRAISCGNLAGGILFDDQNLTTSLSYPLGIANVNACEVGIIDARSNGIQYTITGITNAVSAVVTINTVSATNPIAVGDAVSFANVLGMLQINSATTLQACNVTAIGGVSGAWTVTIGVDTTAYAAYGSGGLLGVGPGIEIWNADDICFPTAGSQANFGPGMRFRSDGTNGVARAHHVLLNDSEANIGPDIQIDGGTLPVSGPGAYVIILGNRSVAVDPRIVDNSTGSLVVKWVPGLNKGAYCFGPDMNVINSATGGAAGYNMNVGPNNAPARLSAVPSGAADTIMRAATHTASGIFNGWELNQYAVFKPLRDNATPTPYSASITIDAPTGNIFDITANNGVAFTINAPTNPQTGTRITIQIRNTSGGALGAVTWNAVFKMSAWTQPANGFSRSIEFFYNGSNWVQCSQTGVDVPN